MKLPNFLYGTAWKEESTQQCVASALAAGFRGIDTANQRKHYYEAGVGEAVKASGISRSELFLQTKFTSQRGQDSRLPYDPSAPVATQVRQSFESSLEHLHTDYLDSFVLHGPSLPDGPSMAKEDWDAWGAMEALNAEKRTRFLGVSNVTFSQLKELNEGAKVKPSFAQIRCFARTAWGREIRMYCREKNIVFQGFSLLTANKDVVTSPYVSTVAERLKVTPSQVIFAFARQVGMLPLTGTKDPLHMKQDLESLSLTLNPEDLKTIEELGTKAISN
jgi:diketogulonate reductase-like aldo/keto reductase